MAGSQMLISAHSSSGKASGTRREALGARGEPGAQAPADTRAPAASSARGLAV